METIFLEEQTPLPNPCVATIGFFDGVHRGHQSLIRQVKEIAHEAGLASVVVTFDRHPRQVLHSHYIPELLTTNEEKLRLLSATGIDTVVVLPFTRDMATLTARQFMAGILQGRLNVRRLVIGYDNRFGHNREESLDDYVRYGRELGMQVVPAQEFTIGGQSLHVSSSAIRKLIREGEVEQARSALGRPYTLTAHVVDGFKEGRKLGFPTANLAMNELGQLLPANGVYAVKARVGGEGRWYRGMTSISTRPTFDGTRLSIETHLLEGFHEDIYGKPLTVAFYKRLRGERRFETLDQLRQRISVDRQDVNDYFSKMEK